MNPNTKNIHAVTLPLFGGLAPFTLVIESVIAKTESTLQTGRECHLQRKPDRVWAVNKICQVCIL